MKNQTNVEIYPYSSSPTSTDSSSFLSTPLTPPPFVTTTNKLNHSYSFNNLKDTSAIHLLTIENVSKVQKTEPMNTPLARYCHALESVANTVYTESIQSVHEPKRKRFRLERDQVIESPRILPFPYHNDSFFLPTAEHDYPGAHSITDASSSVVSLHTFGSRQQLLSHHSTRRYGMRHKSSHSSFNSTHYRPHTYHPSTESFDQKKKNTLFRNKSSPVLFCTDESEKKNPWYKKLWKFFKSSNVKKSNKPSEKPITSRPVWYSQFRSNPPPPPGMVF